MNRGLYVLLIIYMYSMYTCTYDYVFEMSPVFMTFSDATYNSYLYVYLLLQTYRVFIKYCVFTLKFCDFSELCSAGVLPAWCLHTH